MRIGMTPANLEELEAVMRSAANRVGAAVIVAGLLLASAWMARVNDAIAVVGFVVASTLGLYMLWKIFADAGLAPDEGRIPARTRLGRRGGAVVEVRFGNQAPPLP